MITEIINYLRPLTYFFIFFLIFLLIIFFFFLKVSKKFEFKLKKVKYYTLLFETDTKTLFLLSLLLSHYCFFLWCVFTLNSLTLLNYIILIVLIHVYGTICENIKQLLLSIWNSVIECVGLLSLSLITGYLTDIQDNIYIRIIVIMLGFFLVLYVTDFILRSFIYLIELSYRKKGGKNERKNKVSNI